MQDSVEYGNSKINFNIKRTPRKTLGISVLPCGTVEVSAPVSAPIERIHDLIIKRGAWIVEQKRLTNFNPVPQPRKQYITGESFHFLGRQYRLKVFEANYDSVDILNDRIILNCTFPEDVELKRSLLFGWYSKKAHEVLLRRFREKADFYKQLDIEAGVKKLSKTWGEYHPKQRLIILNMELIVAPMECIDYVIIHELCHAIVPDHSSEFYSLLKTRLPNWEQLKFDLEGHSVGLSII